MKHLLNLHQKGLGEDDPAFVSAYRSFEGEVFENFIYEKLLRYAKAHREIEKFIVKGPHKNRTRALSSTLSVNWKGQIVYRTRQKEIGEFDGLIFTKKALYFVEMTLAKSVSNLKKRMRKKKALLEIVFPHYEIKSLVVLNEGAVGINHMPDYATVWVTQEFSAKNVFDWFVQKEKPKRRPFYQVRHKCIVGTQRLKMRDFKYYATLAWILRRVRKTKNDVLDLAFLQQPDVVRYHNLYTKIYIGYIETEVFGKMYPEVSIAEEDKVLVALEKEHNDSLTLTYFMRHSRKRLDNIIVNKKGDVSIAKKDPFGITVTEVAHIDKMLSPAFALDAKQIASLQKTLETFKQR